MEEIDNRAATPKDKVILWFTALAGNRTNGVELAP